MNENQDNICLILNLLKQLTLGHIKRSEYVFFSHLFPLGLMILLFVKICLFVCLYLEHHCLGTILFDKLILKHPTEHKTRNVCLGIVRII